MLLRSAVYTKDHGDYAVIGRERETASLFGWWPTTLRQGVATRDQLTSNFPFKNTYHRLKGGLYSSPRRPYIKPPRYDPNVAKKRKYWASSKGERIVREAANWLDCGGSLNIAG
jgi:hypothetical protein